MSVFPPGIITREVEVGPAFDLVSDVPYSIRVMIVPTRSLVWGATGDPVVAKLKTYTIPAGETDTIELPVTDQPGYQTVNGEVIELGPGENAFGYKFSIFYLINGSIAKRRPTTTVIIPTGATPLDIDELIQFTDSNSGEIISTPDTWSAEVAAAEAAAVAAAASAAAAEGVVSQMEEHIDAAITAHKEEPTPHKAYDLDIPSLTVLFENGLV